MTPPGPPRPWHVVGPAEVESVLGTSLRGLARPEVAARLERHGPNQLEEAPPPSVWALLLHQFTSPLIYILLLAALVTLLLREYADAVVIGAVLALNAVIGFVQERKAEMSVRALMHLVAPHARVIREGREWDVESRELVPGDLVLLESGGRVPADLRLVSATALLVDESLFTGESVPAAKTTAPLDREDLVVGDRTNLAYAGTVVASGRGRGWVVATGGTTELGAIAHQVRTGERAETPLQHRMTRFAQVVGLVVLAAAVAAFALGVARGESVADMFIVAVALAVSAIPEGLPVVFTITLALGVRRMARRNAIIRRLPAVETLGSTTVIGSDKTGTLTENRMTVQKIWAGGRTFTLSGGGPRAAGAALEDGRMVMPADDEPLRLTLLTGVLTNEAEISPLDEGYETQGDPTEAALLVAAARLGLDPAEARARHAVHAEIPFEPERQYSASVRVQADEHVVFVKGAPERVLRMCTRLLAAEDTVDLDQGRVLEAARELASEGLRVLGMATGVQAGSPAPDRPREPAGLTFVGLQGSMDPPRPGVREAIAGCRESGIRVIMITGDHAATARAIGERLGIGAREAPVLTGVELGALDDAALQARVPQVAIYARVAPEHKLRVVQALQRHGEVVAVTGDGVNDAPALKAAEIGVAMGKSGTDVAREAADMDLHGRRRGGGDPHDPRRPVAAAVPAGTDPVAEPGHQRTAGRRSRVRAGRAGRPEAAATAQGRRRHLAPPVGAHARRRARHGGGDAAPVLVGAGGVRAARPRPDRGADDHGALPGVPRRELPVGAALRLRAEPVVEPLSLRRHRRRRARARGRPLPAAHPVPAPGRAARCRRLDPDGAGGLHHPDRDRGAQAGPPERPGRRHRGSGPTVTGGTMPIVCGTDFSLSSARAVRVAALLARRLGEPLVLVHVVDWAHTELLGLTALEINPARERLRRVAERVRRRGLDVREEIASGAPDEALVDSARQPAPAWPRTAGRGSPRPWPARSRGG